MCFDIVHAQHEQYLAGKYVKNSLVLFQERLLLMCIISDIILSQLFPEDKNQF
jgi:hypothetical protein